MDKFFKWTVLFIVLIILASGGVAFYTVFLADKGMTMPSFREMSLIDAVADAEQLGLNVRIEQMESRLPTGSVLAQWPEPGTKIRETERSIILKISRGGERRPIPDIRGIDLARASRILEEHGFIVGDVIRIKDNSNSGLPAGAVIAQSPASPGNIPANHKVDMLVNEGSDDGRFAVPNVSQMTESEAREMLEGVGLRIVSTEKARSRNVPEGQVLHTRPAAGTIVKRGEGIRIFISEGDSASSVATAENVGGTAAVPLLPRPIEPDLTDISVLDQQAIIRRQQELAGVRPETARAGSSALQNDPHSPEFNLALPGVTTPAAPAPVVPAPPAPTVTNTGGKVANVRYQVPPILKPLPLKIEIIDHQGTRVLMERDVRANETIRVDGAYSQEAIVSIWLGGEFVWEDRFR